MDSSLATNPNNPTTSTTAANFHLKVQSASLVSGAIANTQPAQGSSKQFNKSQVSSRYAAASTLENRLKRGGPGADNRSDAAARRTH